ncbi:HAD hydrolase-like protein [bacterium]|nr:HAD hydrolase-like protein [bacterium]
MYTILFDIDGTLLSSGGAGQAAMEEALQQLYGKSEPTSEISTAGRTDFAISRDLFASYGLPWDDASGLVFQETYLQLLPAHLSSRSGMVLPGVVELLEHLSQREDVLLGLLTGNYARGARVKLQHFQLDHHFAFGGYGDHHHHRDDVAREALSQARQYRPDLVENLVWVIGDTPADVQCARAIGARVLAVATGVYSHEILQASAPDLLRPNLSEPFAWLQEMLSTSDACLADNGQ